jgi:hypothetical protein
MYARATMPYEAACDVYSIGIVLVELIVGRLQSGNIKEDYYFKYIKDMKGKDVKDGWRILMKDADGQVTWNDRSLERVCKIAVECITTVPKKRIKTDKLVQELSDVVNRDFAVSNDIENCIQSEHREANLTQPLSKKPKIDGNPFKPCCLCHRTACATIGCGIKNAHLTCVECIEQDIEKQMGESGSGISCAIQGCPGRFNDKALFGKISQNVYNTYLLERERQKPIDDSFKRFEDALKQIYNGQQQNRRILIDIKGGTQDIKDGIQDVQGGIQDVQGGIQDIKGDVQDIKSGIQDITGGVQKAMGALAFLATNDVKKMP